MKRLAAFAIFASMCSSLCLAQANVCEKLIPPQGAFRTVAQNGSVQVFDSAKSWFCSSSFLSYSSSQEDKGGIVVPIDGIPLGANFDANNKKDLQERNDFCGASQHDFTSDQKTFLYIHEGDPTLVKGFVDCIKNTATTGGLIQVETESHASGTFDIKIGSKGYPGRPPRVVSVQVESGATGLLVKQFAKGTPIPFTTDGKSPLVGSYAFQPKSSEAIILVRTSIGDQTVVADRCPSGAAGTWKLLKDVAHPTIVPAPEFQQSFDIPQAGCHPHCKPNQGDQRGFSFTAPAGETLANPRIQCENGRPECPLDSSSARLADNRTLQANVVSRTVGLRFTVMADAFTTQNVLSRDIVQQGDITYGSEFSVGVPNDGNPTLQINGPLGNPIYTPADLAGANLAPWLHLEDPSPITDGTIYTLTVSAPSCASK